MTIGERILNLIHEKGIKPDLSEYMKQTLSTRLSKVSENWMMPGKIGFWDIYTRLPAIELLFLEINHPLHPYLPWLNFL